MFRFLKLTIQIIWAVSIIGVATFIGAIYGWQQHGWVGALSLGFVGFCFGALGAGSPALILHFFR
ncbi:hypothetical protein CIW50_07490 [Tardiphaga sp. P9-11]|nr:hypothetical protein CIW50_07490 [Tardiphaga sp. P9-11]